MTLYEKMLDLDKEQIIKNIEIFKSLENIKCVVPISGGKDSQCCLKLAVSQFKSEEVLGVFCDTQYEHPYTYEHVKLLETLYNVKV